MSRGYGTGGGGPWGPVDEQPPWEDSAWQQRSGQANIWSQDQDAQGYGNNGGNGNNGGDGARGYGGQNYPGQGYGGQDYDNADYDNADYDDAGYDRRDYGQPGAGQPRGGPAGGGQASGAQPRGAQARHGQPRVGQPTGGQPAGRPATGPAPVYRPQGPAAGVQRGPRSGPLPVNPGTGGQPAQRFPAPGTGPRPSQSQRGSGPMPQQMSQPSGYDPRGDQRGPGRRGATPGYGDDYQAMSSPRGGPGWDDQGEDSFLPGFGRRDYFDGRPDSSGDRGQPRRGRYQDEAGYDQQRGDYADPRAARGSGRDAADVRDRGRRDTGDWDGGRDGRDARDDRRRDRDERDARPRRKATRWLPRILILVVVLALVAGVGVGGLFVYHKYEAKYHPADFAGPGVAPTVTVQVTNNQTAEGLAPELVKLGVIASTRAFTIAVEASSDPTGLEAGFFTLNHHMSAAAAFAALLDPKNRIQQGVTIPEGKRASQVALILSEETKIPLKNFKQIIAHPAQLGLPSYADGKVEGYLFPATYAIEPHETALEILKAMVTRFKDDPLTVNLATTAKAVGLTPNQVIIEASMAQAEGGSVSDYPKIARVIINRLKDGMHLQFDSVLLYGLGAYAINVTDKQIATKGPYNDFQHAGLPPGPISNPGDAAIAGILHPATGDWLYFLTVSNGKSEFSATPLQGQ